MMTATYQNEPVNFRFEVPKGGWCAPGAKRHLEDSMFFLSGLRDLVLEAYKRWRSAVESGCEAFELTVRNGYHGHMQRCLDAWESLDISVKECAKAVTPDWVMYQNDNWYTFPLELRDILKENWVPVTRMSALYDDDEELSEENAQFFRDFDSSRSVR